MNVSRRRALQLSLGLAGTTLAGCVNQSSDYVSGDPDKDAESYRTVRILATSDTHGKFVPWNYCTDEEDLSGSLAQLSTVVNHLRVDKNTILVDAGDIIQDNFAEYFVHESPDEIHPMIEIMNAMHYDFLVPGNREFNYGMDYLRKMIGTFKGTTLLGNVVDENGQPVGQGYSVVEKNGLKLGFIGMVTPNITRWDKQNLEGCEVKNPIDEVRSCIEQIGTTVDALIAICHMGMDDEYGTKGSGVRALAEACPELDVIVAAHDHTLIAGEEVNGVLIVENEAHGHSMMSIDLGFEPGGEGWKVVKTKCTPVIGEYYNPNTILTKEMEPYDEKAKNHSHEVIGKLEGGPLAPTGSYAGCPATMTRDTALADLINAVQLHYSGADVSATTITNPMCNMKVGDIQRCDVGKIYPESNTLYTVRLTGAQLKWYMEWSARFYRQWKEGDLTIAFNPKRTIDDYDIFAGVTYDIDVSAKAGYRIKNLKYKKNGKPVKKTDKIVVAVNSARAKNQLLAAGKIFKNSKPKLLKVDIKGDIGGIRELIEDYIENAKAGTIKSTCDKHWKLSGYKWDATLHKRALLQLKYRKIKIWEPKDDRHLIDKPVRESDLVQTKNTKATKSSTKATKSTKTTVTSK